MNVIVKLSALFAHYRPPDSTDNSAELEGHGISDRAPTDVRAP